MHILRSNIVHRTRQEDYTFGESFSNKVADPNIEPEPCNFCLVIWYIITFISTVRWFFQSPLMPFLKYELLSISKGQLDDVFLSYSHPNFSGSQSYSVQWSFDAPTHSSPSGKMVSKNNIVSGLTTLALQYPKTWSQYGPQADFPSQNNLNSSSN